MVGVSRALLGAVALVLASAAGCAGGQHAQARGMTGLWLGAAQDPATGGRFLARLEQDDAGRLSGPGEFDRCARCAGFNQYELSWSGGFDGETLVLIGTPEPVSLAHTIIRFEARSDGEGFTGVVSGLPHDMSMEFVMRRAPEQAERP